MAYNRKKRYAVRRFAHKQGQKNRLSVTGMNPKLVNWCVLMCFQYIYLSICLSIYLSIYIYIYLYLSCEDFSPDIDNIGTLVTLGNSFDGQKNYFNVSSNYGKVTLEETYNHSSLEKPSNPAMVLDGRYHGVTTPCRYEGKFARPNVINLYKRHLSKDEIFLLSKSLEFIPTPKIYI